MTTTAKQQIKTALSELATAYKNYKIAKGVTYNLEVIVQFAVTDIYNTYKHLPTENLIASLKMETEDYIEFTKKEAVA